MPDADSEPTFALVRCQSHPMFSGFLFRLLTQIALYLFVAVYKPGMGKRICLIQTDQVDSMVERRIRTGRVQTYQRRGGGIFM